MLLSCKIFNRRRFKARFVTLIIIIFITVFYIVDISNQDESDDLFVNSHVYIELLRQKYPAKNPGAEADSKCYWNEFGEKEKIESESVNHPRCDDEDWVGFNQYGKIYYNEVYLTREKIQIDHCEYANVIWNRNDYSYGFSEFKPIRDGETVANETEFFHVKCSSKSNRKYRGAFARLFDRSHESDANKNSKEAPLSIFMLGFDSVSRVDWPKLLPKSSKILMDDLNAVVMNGYNIVGDGTPASLVPLLTGRMEHELPNTLRNSLSSHFVDQVYPFIWSNFSKILNYETMFAEDYPLVGTFQYRMKGMSRPPVHHYMRQFELSFSDMINYQTLCVVGQPLIKIHLEYASDFMRRFYARGFFSFMFLSLYSHDSNQRLKWTDEHLYEFLHSFKTSKNANSTALILFSDHGPRFSDDRKTMKGLLKERNPFFAVYMPKTRNDLRANLVANSKRLVTPMDIHRSLIHLLYREKGTRDDIKDQRTISIFESPTASNRTCSEAGIDDHWCLCLTRTEIRNPNDNPYLFRVAQKFGDYINSKVINSHLDQCHLVEVTRINRAHLIEARNIAKRDRNEPKYWLSFFMFLLKEPKIEVDYEEFMFQVETSKGAMFEFTVAHELHLTDFRSIISIKSDTISRIDKYGSSASCIQDTFPDLRKYCTCK